MSTDQLNHYKSKLDFEMDSWDVHEALGKGEPLVVVDGRSADAYAREHIPGAISLPHRGIDSDSTASLDRSRTYVCYCDGIGLDWWKRDGYPTEGDSAQSGSEAVCGC